MKLFESRNLLDRIETVWNMFFSSEWKVRVLPQIVLMTLWTIVGLISFAPIFFLIPGFTAWGTFDDARQLFFIAEVLMVFLLPIIIFTLVGGMTYTYTLSVCHDYLIWRTWQEYARLAWSRLWWWAWYGFWVILMVLLIVAVGIGLYFTSSVLFGFSVLLLVFVYLWLVAVFYAGAPGYILANSWSLKNFFDIFSLTSGRWWNVWGNMILWSIVVSSMVGVLQQLIYWLMGISSFMMNIENLVWDSPIDWDSVFSDISPDSVTRFIFGLAILFVVVTAQKVFITMFQYVVWKDIMTDVPEIVEKKEE